MLRTTGGRHTGSYRLTALWAGAAAAVLFASPAQANTTIFTNTSNICTITAPCWQAGDFGVLVGLYNATTSAWTTSTVNYAGGADVNGEIGIGGSASGTGSKLVFSSGTGNTNWDGPIDFANAISTTSGTCGTGTVACSVASGTVLQRTQGSNTYKTVVAGGTAQAAAEIMAAMNQMRLISGYYSGLSGGTAFNNPSSIGIATAHTGGLHLYTAGTVNQSNALTIHGNADDRIVINITGTATFTNDIILNGVTADQVFFNITGTNPTGDVFKATSTSKTLNGIFYVAADSYNVNAKFGGAGQGARLLGGSGTSTWGSSFVLNAPPDIPDGTPEPATYAIMGAGLCAIFYRRRRRRPVSR